MSQDNDESSIGPAASPQTAQKILGELQLAANSDDFQQKDFARLTKQFMEAIGLNRLQFADKIGISLATFYRWVDEGDGKVKEPRSKIDQLKTLLDDKNKTEESKRTAGPVFAALRNYPELLERQKTCQRQWSLKTMLPFRAAKHQVIKQKLSAFLLEDKHAEFTCVFYGLNDEGSQVSKWAAMNSFAQFKQALYEQDKGILNRIRGWCVDDEALAFRIGLTTLSLGLTILEYSDEPEKKQKRAMIPMDETRTMDGRKVDYFFEIPLAFYPVTSETESISIKEEICWAEWPAHRSSQDWILQRKKLLEDIVNGIITGGVKEFLGDEVSLLKYPPKDYPN